MSWQKILMLLGVIATIHVVVIYGCVGSSSDSDGEEVPADPFAAMRENIFERLFANEEQRQQEIDARKVRPWDYSRTLEIPSALAQKAQQASSVIIVDLSSRRVLWEKNSRNPVAIASLTKLMTALIVAEKLEKDPGFKLDEVITLSRSAASVAYNKYSAGTKFTVRDLIFAMMITSSNDAAHQLAERVAGSVPEFVEIMNQRASEMGLDAARFNSPNGLPQGKDKENSYASTSDILHLCEAVMAHQVIMDACGETYVKLSNGIEVYGHNGLMLYPRPNRPYYSKVPGVFGFKTGFTNAAGCCLAFGVKRGDRVILGCVTGFPTAAAREPFCKELIEWAYQTPQE